ncbi:unnamed protein product [Enterobius vermicularis]|uniref:FERM domain-containing protein n=1 Tax=Enterobius vermicularis TaxID=51028 RepID=A0A0N4VH29_ENTVE|nr:unnamed protein product [Enterobius vermicularis]
MGKKEGTSVLDAEEKYRQIKMKAYLDYSSLQYILLYREKIAGGKVQSFCCIFVIAFVLFFSFNFSPLESFDALQIGAVVVDTDDVVGGVGVVVGCCV